MLAFTSAAQIVTSAPLGVSGYEWSPDGKYLAYTTRDSGPSTPPIANHVGFRIVKSIPSA